MKIWVGDETGLLKGVKVETKQITEKWRQQDRNQGIQRMCWGPGSSATEREQQIVLGLKNCTVAFCDARTGDTVRQIRDFGSEIVGLDIPHSTQTLATCTSKGVVQYRDLGAEDIAVTYEQAHGDDVYRMRTCPGNGNLYALGGKNKDLRVMDISRKDPVFKAKNVSNDMLDLQVPVWIRDLAFVPHSDGTKVVTVSAHKHIRLYDTKVKKKPIFSEEFGEHPIMAVDVTSDGNYAIFGNSIGEMRKVDLRNGKIAGGFKGPAGSIRSVMVHPELPYVASCGLDRHAYVHKTDGTPVAKVYLKQQLNAVLFSHEAPEATHKTETQGANGAKAAKDAKAENGEEGAASDDDGEDVWDTLEVVKDQGSKRKSAAAPSKAAKGSKGPAKKKAKESQ